MSAKGAHTDAVIAGIAARQHGVVTSAQLLAAGISRDQILHRRRTGRLHRVHQGVYAVGHAALNRDGRWTAAVLACGDGALLSHQSAAALWSLLDAGLAPVHVTIRGRNGRKTRRGLCIHHSVSLSANEMARRNGIPVTSVPRTLSDLRRVLPAPRYRHAVRQAEALGLATGLDLSDRTRSELEHRFLRLCRRHRLPSPEVNTRLDRFTVDFLWQEERLIVETDGYRYHRGRQAFEQDRIRDLELRLAGFEVLRLSYRQVFDDGAAVAAAVRRLLLR